MAEIDWLRSELRAQALLLLLSDCRRTYCATIHQKQYFLNAPGRAAHGPLSRNKFGEASIWNSELQLFSVSF
jgi:hypothetical protein